MIHYIVHEGFGGHLIEVRCDCPYGFLGYRPSVEGVKSLARLHWKNHHEGRLRSEWGGKEVSK